MNSKQKLHSWFLINKRDLPFRNKKTAYHIWISEVMLQQTRVTAMLPLYNKFIETFPNVETLAQATEEEVLSAWQGLGYYSRARNIRKAAIYLQQNFNGSFPKQLDEILKVPGIGPYTARAVLSIAYDLPYAVLDGNVKRVLARFFLYHKNILGSTADRDLQILADSFLNTEAPGDHNQALMELGATLCLPENPKCLLCPLRGACKAEKDNLTKEIPIRDKEKKQIELSGKIYWIEWENKILLIRQKNPRFLKGMFVLPMFFDGDLPSTLYESTNSMNEMIFELKYKSLPKLIKHTITHHKFSLSVNFVKIDDLNQHKVFLKKFEDLEYKWIPIASLTSEFPSSLAKKVLAVIANELY
ncbi:MAG: A/G-specific adenine glycosylase [Leptospira sp.]|nr:A/G-specific adenine glycosylase [Leptospira sp.]